MSDEHDDCGCEEDISHFLHNLDYFAKVCDSLKHIALTKTEVLNLFNTWLNGIEEQESVSTNPFIDMITDMISNSTENLDPDFSFSINLEEDDEDDENE